LLVENHEFNIVLSEEPFKELEAESAQSVSVGHHNFSNSALKAFIEKEKELFSSIVKSRPNIFENGVVWIFSVHEICLSFEIVSLLRR
jgi:hypothetical protein